MSVLERPPSQTVDEFISLVKQHHDFDEEHIAQLIPTIIAGDMSKYRLEQRWYRSLDANEPDYSVYADDEYIAEAWMCWALYSRKYLLALQKPTRHFPQSVSTFLTDNGIKSVADLGCGFGYTTSALKQIFSAATVYGTNFKDSLQFKVASSLSSAGDFHIRGSVDEIEQADLVWASEYFEHFERPMSHLWDVLNELKPKAMLIQNSFGTKAVGHFDHYKLGTQTLTGRNMSIAFNKGLRQAGWKAIKTGWWNERPKLWIKVR